MEVFVIYDHVGGFYEQPFFAINRGHAERGISDLARIQPDHPIVLHCHDYSLFHLGSWKSDSGTFTLFSTPEHVTCLSSILPTTRGAAVGGSTPLKPQSDIYGVSVDAENNSIPACDADTPTSSKATDEVQ